MNCQMQEERTVTIPYANPFLFDYSKIQIENKEALLKRFLDHLTFQSKRRANQQCEIMTEEEFELLKRKINYIYESYKSKTLKNIQGLWPFLSLSFSSKNGLYLYLKFQQMLLQAKQQTEIPIKIEQSEITKEKVKINQKLWKDRQFLKRFRVLQKTFEPNGQSSLIVCTNLIKIINPQNQNCQFLAKHRQFSSKFQEFTLIIKSKKDTHKLPFFVEVFTERLFQRNMVLSEPDKLDCLLQNFRTFQQYKKHYAIITKQLSLIGPMESDNFIEQNKVENIEMNIQYDSFSITKYNQSTVVRKESEKGGEKTLKRNKAHLLQPRQGLSHDIQKPEIKRFFRPSRKQVIEKRYHFENKISQNYVYAQMLKKNKNKKIKVNKLKKRNQCIRRIQKHQSASSQQSENSEQILSYIQQKNKKAKNIFNKNKNYLSPNKHRRQMEQEYDEQIMNLEDSSPIQVKRRRKLIKPRLLLSGQRQYDSQDDMIIPKHKAFSQSNFNEKESGDQIIQFAQIQRQYLDVKYNYLHKNQKKIDTNNKFIIYDSIANFKVRNIDLDFNLKLPTENIHEYSSFVDSFKNEKQIKKEMQKVIKQSLNLENGEIQVKHCLKLLAMLARPTSSPLGNIWNHYKEQYILPTLKSSIEYIVTMGFFQLLNNFYVSTQNQDLSKISQTRRAILEILRVSNSRGISNCFYENKSINETILTMIYSAMLKTASNFQNELIVQKYFKIQLLKDEKLLVFMILALIFDSLFLKDSQILNQIKQKGEPLQKQFFGKFSKILNDKGHEYKDKILSIEKWVQSLQRFMNEYSPRISSVLFNSIMQLIFFVGKLISNKDRRQIKSLQNRLSSFLKQFFTKASQHKQQNTVNRKLKLNYLIIGSDFKNNFCITYHKHHQNVTLSHKSPVKFSIYCQICITILKMPYFKTNEVALDHFKKEFIEHTINVIKQLPFISTDYQKFINLLAFIYKQKLFNQMWQKNDDFTGKSQPEIAELQSQIIILYKQLKKRYDKFKQMPFSAKQVQIERQIDENVKNFRLFMRQLVFDDNFQGNSAVAEAISINQSLQHYFFVLKFLSTEQFFCKQFKQRSQSYERDSIKGFKSYCCDLIAKLLSHIYIFKSFVYISKLKTINREDEFELILLKQDQNQKYKQIFSIFSNLFEEKVKESESKMATAGDKIYLNLQLFQQNQYQFYHLHAYLHAFCFIWLNQNRKLQSTKKIYFSERYDSFNDLLSYQKQLTYNAYFFERILQDVTNRYSNVGKKNRESLERIKGIIWKQIVERNIKEIVKTICVGFIFKNQKGQSNSQLIRFLESIRKLRLFQSININQNSPNIAYQIFLLAVQQQQLLPFTLDNLLDKFKQISMDLILNKRNLNQNLNVMFEDIYSPYKKILTKIQDKSLVIIESIKVLTFLLQWSEKIPTLIKRYLIDLQVISNSQSYIGRVKMTFSNFSALAKLFAVIQSISEDFSGIKSKKIMQEYIRLLFQESNNLSIKYKQEKHILLFHTVSEIVNKTAQHYQNYMQIRKICLSFIQKIIASFFAPFFHIQNNLFKKQILNEFVEKMKNSNILRYKYEKYFIDNKEKINIFLKTNENDVRDQIRCQPIEKIVLSAMIGNCSDFYETKMMIIWLRNQNYGNIVYQDIVLKILEKFKLQLDEEKHYLMEWSLAFERQIKHIQSPASTSRILSQKIDRSE